jgi:hypothetical protein
MAILTYVMSIDAPLVDRDRGVTTGLFRPDPHAVSRFDPNFGRKFSRAGIERLKRGGK